MFPVDLPAKPVKLAAANTALLAERDLGAIEEIQYASDGKTIQGWIVKPPAFDAAKKYPLLVDVDDAPRRMCGSRVPSARADLRGARVRGAVRQPARHAGVRGGVRQPDPLALSGRRFRRPDARRGPPDRQGLHRSRPIGDFRRSAGRVGNRAHRPLSFRRGPPRDCRLDDRCVTRARRHLSCRRVDGRDAVGRPRSIREALAGLLRGQLPDSDAGDRGRSRSRRGRTVLRPAGAQGGFGAGASWDRRRAPAR